MRFLWPTATQKYWSFVSSCYRAQKKKKTNGYISWPRSRPVSHGPLMRVSMCECVNNDWNCVFASCFFFFFGLCEWKFRFWGQHITSPLKAYVSKRGIGKANIFDPVNGQDSVNIFQWFWVAPIIIGDDRISFTDNARQRKLKRFTIISHGFGVIIDHIIIIIRTQCTSVQI